MCGAVEGLLGLPSLLELPLEEFLTWGVQISENG